MAFGSFVLTDFGHNQLVKSHAGKEIHFSRMALGDGDIGTSSVYDVTALKSERLSLLIDAVSITDAKAIITVLLQSSAVDTGFYLKEMGLMATDPDTAQEGVYAYNRDSSEGEYIPDKSSSSKLSEYLRVHCNVEGATNITFNSSGNPLWITRDELVSEVANQISAKAGVDGGLALYDTLKTFMDSKGKAGGLATYDDTVPIARKINGHALNQDIVLTAVDVNAPAKSTLVSVTLPASGWTGTDAPYSQTVSVAGATATNANEIIPGLSLSDDQLDALQGANIQDGGQATDQITLLAYGDKPTIDLPIRIIVRRDL